MDIKNRYSSLAEECAKLAEEAILTEALLTPKPGLVDAKDSGSHQDMDIFTFVRSAVSLRTGFQEMFLSGATSEVPENRLLDIIRPIGIRMEQEMFEATKGINTHKGIIFSMGLLLAAFGRKLSEDLYSGDSIPVFTPQDTERIFKIIMETTKGLVTKDFRDLEIKENLTHGEKLYLKYGFTGIRGEAEKGYPVLRDQVLPYLRSLDKQMTYEETLLETLFLLMKHVEDSNIVTRGGMESLSYVRSSAERFLHDGGMCQQDAFKKLQVLNEEFIRRNLSPGGAADLLSLAILLGKVEQLL
ncbi:triphosphoribosyl-dephospho-CoA synthase CitG [Proteiniclasticum ruminis]|uniref:Probable 2-(5''-triphosphoribosyl)-3'-dephosphocoenzyme-A synthase n=1 Tax=Proteiniclasticum ruminis TaxID=398199 RepID=A0A1G8T7I7_9CLOT|nr:triphosphoribosyl-dephospho-CoA synthase CitG [Proteiniclasticum ruminis]SDJ37512.1 triphosphoribosyl-dephospho-CoA synthase [Proteiniclasticum ruminis]